MDLDPRKVAPFIKLRAGGLCQSEADIAGNLRTREPIDGSVDFYFEVECLEYDERDMEEDEDDLELAAMSIGLVSEDQDYFSHVGSSHGNTPAQEGLAYTSSGTIVQNGVDRPDSLPGWGSKSDIVGCGVIGSQGYVFFTRNGKQVGPKLNWSRSFANGIYYPAFSL